MEENDERDLLATLRKIIERNGELDRILRSLEFLMVQNNTFVIIFDPELVVLEHSLPVNGATNSLGDFVPYIGKDIYEGVRAVVEGEKSMESVSEQHTEFLGSHIKYTLYRSEEGQRTYILQLTSRGRPEKREKTEGEEIWQRTSDQLSDVQKLLDALEDIRKIGTKVRQEDVRTSIRGRHLPELRALKQTIDDPIVRLCLDIIEKNLNEIVSPDTSSIPPALYARLTPSEIQIAEFIRMGKRRRISPTPWTSPPRRSRTTATI
jgi:hypothetical protein